MTPTGTRPAPVCVGNCDGNERVTVAELIKGVNIALGKLPLSECDAFDQNNNGKVEINELVAAVNAALDGCP